MKLSIMARWATMAQVLLGLNKPSLSGLGKF